MNKLVKAISIFVVSVVLAVALEWATTGTGQTPVFEVKEMIGPVAVISLVGFIWDLGR